MRSKYVLNKNNKNTNPKIKNLKITIFSNPAKSSNPKASKYQINPKIQHNQSNKKKKTSNSEKPIPSKLNPANPLEANLDPVAMLPADELFSDGKLVPLHLSSVKPQIIWVFFSFATWATVLF